MAFPPEAAYEDAASAIGCDLPAIRAVFDVEAAGQFVDAQGVPIGRFEPHHFPRAHWPEIGFDNGSDAAWRASLKVSTSRRRKMYEAAFRIDAEAANRASSWGAPQIMGFNCKDAGYRNATAMKQAFANPAEQVAAFTRFIIAQGLDGAIRAHDWLAFATKYNGPGQAPSYAAKLETAYRKRSGKASAEVLRRGAHGASVEALQARLAAAGYLEAGQVDGAFGPATEAGVRAFQEANGLTADGIVGARTWAALPEAKGAPEPVKQESRGGQVAKAAGVATADIGGGAVAASAAAVALDPERVAQWSDLLGFPPYVIFIGAGALAIGLIAGPRVLRWVEARK